MTSSIIIIIGSLLYVHHCTIMIQLLFLLVRTCSQQPQLWVLKVMPLLMTMWFWRLYDVDSFKMLVAEKLLWWPFPGCWCRRWKSVPQHLKLVTNTECFQDLSSTWSWPSRYFRWYSLSLWFYLSMVKIISKFLFHHFQIDRVTFGLWLSLLTLANFQVRWNRPYSSHTREHL